MTNQQITASLRFAIASLKALADELGNDPILSTDSAVSFKVIDRDEHSISITLEANGTIVVGPSNTQGRYLGKIQGNPWHRVAQGCHLDGWPSDLERTCPRCGGNGQI